MKIFFRGMAIGIFLPCAMQFNEYLSTEFRIDYFFPVPDWYQFVHIMLFFPLVVTISMNTYPPLTTHELLTLGTAIVASGFLYGIVFVFISKIASLLRQMKNGEI